MHPHLTAVFARLDESRAAVREAMDLVPTALRRTQPGPRRWSVAEVLEHLALVNRFFAQRMVDAIEAARAAGLGPESLSRDPIPAEVERNMIDRGNVREAREAMMPSGAIDASAAWDDLELAREAVRTAATRGDGLALGSVRADHRLFGSLSIYQWVELTAAHERRHADQIREIGAALTR